METKNDDGTLDNNGLSRILRKTYPHNNNNNNGSIILISVCSGVMQATTGDEFEKRYSPNFKIDESLRRQSSTKRKRDEVLRLVSIFIVANIVIFSFIFLFAFICFHY